MADLVPLLTDIRGVYSDIGRDRLPPGSVWELVDWVPVTAQAGARQRGAWVYQSPALPSRPDGMIYAPYLRGPKLLVANAATLSEVPVDANGAKTVGAIPATLQNPVFHRNRVIVPAADGVTVAKYVVWDGTQYVFTDGPAINSPNGAYGRYATVWKDRLVLANTVAQPQQVAFSKPGQPDQPWDIDSIFNTNYPVTGLAAQRTQVLAFHDSSVERLRGTTPPDSAASPDLVTGDMNQDVLFDRAGCYDARSIAPWNDNVLFCDSRGIFLTDGALVKNLAYQAGIQNLWHQTFQRGLPDTISGAVHRDYYVVTVRQPPLKPVTFVIDLQQRRAFTFGNIDSTCFAFSIGSAEKLFGTHAITKQVTDMTNVFDPDVSKLQIDGNGDAVLPVIATGWSRLTKKPGFKRIIDMHLSYVADRDDDVEVIQADYVPTPISPDRNLGQFHTTAVDPDKYARRKMYVRRRMEGFAVRLTQLLPTRDTRLYDISLRAFPEEASKT